MLAVLCSAWTSCRLLHIFYVYLASLILYQVVYSKKLLCIVLALLCSTQNIISVTALYSSCLCMCLFLLFHVMSPRTVARRVQRPNAGYWHAFIQSFTPVQPFFAQKSPFNPFRPDLSERQVIVHVLSLLALQKELWSSQPGTITAAACYLAGGIIWPVQ